MMNFQISRRLAIARLLIGIVMAWNLQAALAFLLQPKGFAAAFGLPAEAGAAVVAGTGLLFVMWNVPYALALWHPLRHRTSLYEAVLMQTIGLVGESLILLHLDPAQVILHTAITRFVFFDLAGLALLVLAVCLVQKTAVFGVK